MPQNKWIGGNGYKVTENLMKRANGRLHALEGFKREGDNDNGLWVKRPGRVTRARLHGLRPNSRSSQKR